MTHRKSFTCRSLSQLVELLKLREYDHLVQGIQSFIAKEVAHLEQLLAEEAGPDRMLELDRSSTLQGVMQHSLAQLVRQS